MVTMAKKAKKVRSEVIVTADQVSAGDLPDSDQEKEVRPSKKNNKKRKPDSTVASEITQKESAVINGSSHGPAVRERETVEEKSSSKSFKERMKVRLQ